MTQIHVAVLVFAVMVTGACGEPRSSQAGRVLHLGVRIETTPEGALLVRETYDLEADQAGRIRFVRRIGIDRADSTDVIEASADGVPVSHGSSGFDVSKDDATDLEAGWTTSGAPLSRHQLTMTIRVASGVSVTQPRAGLTWPVLPANRGYAVGKAEVELALPPQTPIYPGTGMLESGWTVTRTPIGITAVKEPVGDSEGATLVAAFDFDRTRVADPVWERNLDRQRQFLPALLAGALFFFTIGIGTLIILRAQYPSRKRPVKTGRVPPAEADRRAAARGLLIAGIVGAGVAAASAAVSATFLSFLGIGTQIIPASMLIVAASFVFFAPRLLK